MAISEKSDRMSRYARYPLDPPLGHEEYAKEEKWIEEIRAKTLTLKFRAKDYILKLKEARVTQNKKEENQERRKSRNCEIKPDTDRPKKYSRKWKRRNN